MSDISSEIARLIADSAWPVDWPGLDWTRMDRSMVYAIHAGHDMDMD